MLAGNVVKNPEGRVYQRGGENNRSDAAEGATEAGVDRLRGPLQAIRFHTPRNLWQARGRREERMEAMIFGAHVIIYSKDAEADRAFFRDMLGFPCVDAGHGWLIFAMPAAEVAFHSADHNDRADIYLMCDNLQEEIAQLVKKEVVFEEPHQERWGLVTKIRLPGGGSLGLYQPAHPVAIGLVAG
jgi:catechol 2,3-dioxygenase-like lactoylglutathione lyase family enzyme